MLTEVACRKAAPKSTDYKLADAGGLSLLVRPTGTKVWLWKYRVAGRERKLTIGRYPDLSLREAREARDRARRQLDEGTDPSTEKQRRRRAAAIAPADTLEALVNAWHRARSPGWSERYGHAVLSRLTENVLPQLGNRAPASITPAEVLDVLRAVGARGARDMAKRVRQHLSDVFVFGIASGLTTSDPAAIVRGALEAHVPRLRPAKTKLADARDFLAKLESLEPRPYWATVLATRLLALTAVRPGNARLAELREFEGLDGDKPLWRIPAAKMKLSKTRKADSAYDFLVPLSPQAVAVARLAAQLSEGSPWLFPGVGDRRRPLTDSTLSKHHRRADPAGGHVPHGWRASFSTVMNERAAEAGRPADRAIIDLMLAHVESGVEAAYNRAAYLPRRRALAEEWADLLTAGLAEPLELLPAHLQRRLRP